MNVATAHRNPVNFLLTCGILASILYPVTDLVAGNLYKGYNFNEQTVSELFAIGARTSQLVVTLFSVSSLLLIGFAYGIWKISQGNRKLRALAVMILGNAINSLILWNFFPMHQRGATLSFTDTMHGILAINPFVLVSLVLGAIYFRNWFRYYSAATIVLLIVTAVWAFSKALLVYENQPTPGLGILERVSQYGHQLWHALLAIQFLPGKRKQQAGKVG